MSGAPQRGLKLPFEGPEQHCVQQTGPARLSYRARPGVTKRMLSSSVSRATKAPTPTESDWSTSRSCWINPGICFASGGPGLPLGSIPMNRKSPTRRPQGPNRVMRAQIERVLDDRESPVRPQSARQPRHRRMHAHLMADHRTGLASRAVIARWRASKAWARSTTGTSIILPSTVIAPTPSAVAFS